MAPVTPLGPLTSARAGDTWTWKIRNLTDYPQSEGWALRYELTGPDRRTIIPVFQTSGDDVNHWLVTVAASDTAPLPADEGIYRLSAYVTGSGAYAGRRDSLPSASVASFSVLPNPVTGQPGDSDGKTHDQRALELLEAAIEGRLPASLESYSLGGRSLAKIPMVDMVRLRDRYAAAVARQRSGRVGRPVYTRFPRVA